ncbi:hemicentin-2-like isoform X2 [Clupea harengus]|uniref:Hemicentin-2-like isoform X2 n=1 Tax=Clupea harengus TaxID=7950 RepID=A0A6P8G071_CLUHA|nr:hemicentin-2-like isoform X2 [Clupea harengus]
MANHMCLYGILLFTMTESVLSLPLRASLSDPRGPHFTSIKGPSKIKAGVTTEFVCSAMCTPECSYTWQVSGQEAQGDTLTVTVSGQHQSLELVCTAVNPTNNDSQSTDKTVQVDNQVMVNPTTGADPQEGHAFMLACKGSGPGITTVWYKDNEPIAADQRIWLTENHAMLNFSSLLPPDGGYYECVVTNSTIRVTSRGYQLSFGTIAVSLLGPDTVEAGVEHTFTCQADCTLACSITWSFPHGFPQGSFSFRGDTVRWTPATPGLVQVFQCSAQNSLAQRTAQATKRVTVSAPPTTPAPPLPPTPSGSVVERPSLALVSMVCLQLLFALSA